MSKVRVLHILSALNHGGVESMLYNYYTHMDRDRVAFDFIVYSDRIGGMEADFEALGSKVFHVTPKKVSFTKSTREIKAVIKNGGYDCVHVHQGFSSFNSLMLARRYRVPIKVVHNHGTAKPSGIARVIVPFLNFLNWHYSDWRFACSLEAGENMFGKSYSFDDKCMLMKNAISADDYAFNDGVRMDIRERLGATDTTLVLMHAGRMAKEKNQEFLIRTFAALQKKVSDSMLVLAGDGPMREELEGLAFLLGISDKLRFTGVLRNLNEWYSAADVFVLPSHSEGLGMVAIEAQISGLSLLCSTGVPRSVAIMDNVAFLSLFDSFDVWSDKIIELSKSERVSGLERIKAEGYEISAAAELYQNWLLTNTR